VDGSDPAKAESVRKVLRIAVRRASSLPGDVVDTVGACTDHHVTSPVAQSMPTYADASVATDAPSGTLYADC